MLLLKFIKNNAKKVNSKKEIEQVATISANSDTAIGQQIAEAMERVGRDGVITVEEAKGMEDELKLLKVCNLIVAIFLLTSLPMQKKWKRRFMMP